jgi:hypothetical protein
MSFLLWFEEMETLSLEQSQVYDKVLSYKLDKKRGDRVGRFKVLVEHCIGLEEKIAGLFVLFQKVEYQLTVIGILDRMSMDDVNFQIHVGQSLEVAVIQSENRMRAFKSLML